MLFPGRGTPATNWQIPQGGEQRTLWAQTGGGDGPTGGLALQRMHVHTEAHLLTCMYMHVHTGNPTSHMDLQKCWGEICVKHAYPCVHACTRQLHACAGQRAHTVMGSHWYLYHVYVTHIFIYVNPHSHISRHSHEHRCMSVCT